MNSTKKLTPNQLYQNKRLSSGTIRHIPSRQAVKRRQSIQLTKSIQRSIQTTCTGKRSNLISNLFNENKFGDRCLIKSLKKQHRTMEEKFLLKKSDKMKLVYSSVQSYIFYNIIVIAADFIINQDSFWNNQSIKHTIIKDWRNLTKNRAVCWVIRRQSTLEKLKQFSSVYDLRLDGVFLVKRNNNYLVDYSPVIRNMSDLIKTHQKTQIIIIECIKVNQKDNCGYETYRGRIPILLPTNINTKVALIRTGQPDGLEKPIQAINKLTFSKQGIFKCPQVSANIPLYIESFIKKEDWKIKKIQYKLDSESRFQTLDENEIQSKLQNFRRELISSITQIYGKDYKIEGYSIYYIVGDMIKRNYNLLTKQMGKVQKKDKEHNNIEDNNKEKKASKQFLSTNFWENFKEKLNVDTKYYEFS